MFQRAQLFERFRLLERRLRQRGEAEQKLPAIGVEAEVLVSDVVSGFSRTIAMKGNWRAREIQRVVVGVYHHLDDVRARVILLTPNGVRSVAISSVGSACRASTILVMASGFDEWLVSLNIHNDGAVQFASDLRDLVGAVFCVAAVIRATPPKRRTASATR